ncbi:MAG: hypothetical protein KME31_02210 [Tolypothrix carrinoi HA7290-LM1]|jgi:uncharacterized protein YkwD|nr:hypothetical protein [Tolypothrix carrinoi HA7290-LM1]
MARRKRIKFIKNNTWWRYVLLVLLALTSALNPHQTLYNYKNSLEDSQAAIHYVNELINQYKKKPISFDIKAFELAVARAKDMSQYKYYNHTNPHTGNCSDKMKYQYGFNKEEYLAENLLGYEKYSENIFTRIKLKPMTYAVDNWMDSRGHRYNLLYEKHIAGAIGCYKDKCVFLGLNHDKFGSGCHTAAEGRQHWNNVPRQPGEVDWNSK